MSDHKCSGSVNFGTGIGTSVAAVVSWSINHSIGWALVHAFFGWFYLLYYACGGGHK
jgi:hypothetical protein